MNSIIGDLMYLDHDYLSSNSGQNVNEELVAKSVLNYAKKKYSPTDAPIVIGESIAYV